MNDLQDWLLNRYEDGSITRGDLRSALVSRLKARELWVEFCDSDMFVDECQEKVEQFLEMLDDVD